MQFKHISKTLINWYDTNKRDLPWRETTDPYRIWISEIVLQQTRVVQGLAYYNRFMERFPDVVSLAQAHEDEVLKYWQGLGYYSRARNLHKAAKTIATDYGGVFPERHADILKLSGIGRYTAAAIASFAYNQPFAVLDGNVFRVVARLFAVHTAIDSTEGVKEFTMLTGQLLNKNNPAAHNQAIMEFGALHCTPQQPGCADCPLQHECRAFALSEVDLLPVKAKKTKVRDRYFNYFFVQCADKCYLQKRESKDIWQNLYELPLVEADRLYETDDLFKLDALQPLWDDIEDVQVLGTPADFKHILSHQRIFARFFKIRISGTNHYYQSKTEIQVSDIEKYAVSRLSSLFFEQIF